ncbi:MAG TPA: GrpB family protein [Streptosporangiaceae bacterium]
MEGRSVIEVVEYDEAWPVRAAAARADLISLGVFDAVEPIGSTSVPGLAAKPVIDLMAATASLDAVAAAQDALAGLGYRRFDTGMPGRLSPGARLGGVSYRADQPPSSRYEEPLANDAGAEQR